MYLRTRESINKSDQKKTSETQLSLWCFVCVKEYIWEPWRPRSRGPIEKGLSTHPIPSHVTHYLYYFIFSLKSVKEKIYFLIYLHIVKKFDFDIFPFHSLFRKFSKKITILSLAWCSQRNLEQLPTPCMMFSLRKLHLSAGYKLHPRGVTLSHSIQSKIAEKVSKIDNKKGTFHQNWQISIQNMMCSFISP